MFTPNLDPYYVRLRQCELADSAAHARLVRRAARAQGHPSLRQQVGQWLVAAGEVLQATPAGEVLPGVPVGAACTEPC